MNSEAFWQLVDQAADEESDLDERIGVLTTELAELTDEEIAGFRDQLQACLAQAMRSDLYAAGVLLTGRTFDEERFEAFRCLLVLKGRAVYEGALRNPDSLADVMFTQPEKELDFVSNMLLYAPEFAYQERHGDEAALEDTYPATHIEVAPVVFAYNKDELMRAFPRLWPQRRAMVEPKVMDE